MPRPADPPVTPASRTRPAVIVILAAVGCAAAALAPAAAPASAAPGPPGPAGKPAATAYVANLGSGTVSRVDTATGRTEPAVRVGRRSLPLAIAVTPNGTTVYVASYLASTVTPISTRTGRPGHPVKVPRLPDYLTVAPNGKTVYVASEISASDQEPGRGTPISTATDQAGKSLRTGIDPGPIVVSPDSRNAYVLTDGFSSQAGGGNVTVISTATDTVRRLVRFPGAAPVDLAMTPDGRTIYVASQDSPAALIPIPTATLRRGKPIRVGGYPDTVTTGPDSATVYVFTTGGQVVAVRTRTGQIAWTAHVGGVPAELEIFGGEQPNLAVTPGGRTLYALSDQPGPEPGSAPGFVTAVSAATGRPGHRIPVCRAAELVEVTPNGRAAYVVCAPFRVVRDRGEFGIGTVIPISTATNQARRPIRVGRGPMALVIAP
jgi:DNA-binding beta-propeller fold protein YncE